MKSWRAIIAALLVLGSGVGIAHDAAPARAVAPPAPFTVPGFQPDLVVADGLLFDAPLGNADDVEVFDRTGAYLARIGGMDDVRSMSAGADGRTVYVALGHQRDIAVIDTTTLHVVGHLDVSALGEPGRVVVAGRRLYVTATGSGAGYSLGVVDLDAAEPTGRFLFHDPDTSGPVAVLSGTDVDRIYVGDCSAASTCTLTRGEYTVASGAASFSQDAVALEHLASIAVATTTVLTSTIDGTVQLRDPDDLTVRGQFAGAPQGAISAVTPTTVVQRVVTSGGDAARVEERSFDGTLLTTYRAASGTGVTPVVSPDGADLLVSQSSPAAMQQKIITVRGGLRAVPAGTSTGPAPTAPGMFVPVTPTRLLDTRTGLGAARPGPRATLSLQVLGRGPVPADGVSSVVLTITVTASSAAGYLTAFPGGAGRPAVSTVNFAKGATVANETTVPVGANGKVSVYNGSAGPAQVLADVAGYYLAGTPSRAGAFVATTPTRLLDTRTPRTTPVSGGSADVKVLGRASIPPSGVSAVVLNLTATGATSSGYLTAYADGADRPPSSNLNFAAGSTVANAVVVPVGTDGYVDVHNGSTRPVDVLVDVLGYFLDGDPVDSGAFVPVTPTRVLDTRSAVGTSRPAARSVASMPVAGRIPVPRGEVAAVINLTAVSPRASGYLTAYPRTAPRPTSSTLNFPARVTVAGLAEVRLGTDGGLAIYNGSTAAVDVVGDLAGYYVSGPTTEVAPATARAIDVRPVPRGGGATGCLATPRPFVGGALELTVGTAVTDPNGGSDALHAHFRLRDLGGYGAAESGDVLVGFDDEAGTSTTVYDGGYASVRLPMDQVGMSDGHLYAVDERTDDDHLTSAVSPACTFWLDTTAPDQLTVTPAQSTYKVGTPARVDLAAADALPSGGTASGVDHFAWSTSSTSVLAGDGGTHVAANPKDSVTRGATISFTPATWGTGHLYVVAVDGAGNESPVQTYEYYAAG